jgi:hypothetical protein
MDDNPLNEEFTLMDVAYIYRWRRVIVTRILLHICMCVCVCVCALMYACTHVWRLYDYGQGASCAKNVLDLTPAESHVWVFSPSHERLPSPLTK